MSAQGVFTPEYRFRFVEKSESEVGDGKRWNMKVTLDQLAEIYYRVKDSKFTAGSYSEFTPSDIDESLITVSLNSSSTPSDNFAISLNFTDSFPNNTPSYPGIEIHAGIERSYCANGGDQDLSYFSDSYTQTVGIYDYEKCDILNNERGMWLEKDTAGNFLYDFNSYGIPTGFNWWVYSLLAIYRDVTVSGYDTIPEDVLLTHPFLRTEFQNPVVPPSPGSWFAFNFNLANIQVVFLREVAWVDVNGSGNPFDPLNEVHIGVMAYFENLCTFEDNTVFPEVSWGASSHSSTGMRFVLKLSGEGNEVSCPLYWFPYYGETGFDYGSPVLTEGDDFILEATEWWPYAKGSPATPVWNVDTGAKL